MTEERRICDIELASIKDSVSSVAIAMKELATSHQKQALLTTKIETYLSSNHETLKICREETKANSKSIEAIRVKQSILTYIGAATFVTVIGAGAKYISKHF